MPLHSRCANSTLRPPPARPWAGRTRPPQRAIASGSAPPAVGPSWPARFPASVGPFLREGDSLPAGPARGIIIVGDGAGDADCSDAHADDAQAADQLGDDGRGDRAPRLAWPSRSRRTKNNAKAGAELVWRSATR